MGFQDTMRPATNGGGTLDVSNSFSIVAFKLLEPSLGRRAGTLLEQMKRWLMVRRLVLIEAPIGVINFCTLQWLVERRLDVEILRCLKYLKI